MFKISIEEKPTNKIIVQLKRSFILAKKDLRIYYNKPPVLIQGLIFPIILFVAFTIGRQIQNYQLVSGLTAMVLFLTTTSISPIIFPWETMRKTLERLITCPISIKTILLGSLWSSFIYGLTFSIIPLILGMFFLPLEITISFIFIILGILIAALVFASVSLILSVPPYDTPGNTMVLTILIKFPLLFISPLFIPINNMPISVISPLTYIIDIINFGLGQVSAFGDYGILLDFTVLTLIGFGCLFLSFTLHNKTFEKRFRG